jgi:methionyl-tRNA formyltransferase
VRVLVFAGTHLRHLHFFQKLFELDLDFSAIVMQREDSLPPAPEWATEGDRALFDRHFRERALVENKFFGHANTEGLFGTMPTLNVSPETLNSPTTVSFLREQNPDAVVVFGSDLIKGQLLEALPEFSINLHLGLSPWYRGAATLFWPFYFLEPNYSGATFHKITSSPDAGAILHQSVPPLDSGDGIHDVAAKTVTAATEEFTLLLEKFAGGKRFELTDQTAQGKLFSRYDFKPAHLRMIYERFDNDIVREFLEGKLSVRQPKLITAV